MTNGSDAVRQHYGLSGILDSRDRVSPGARYRPGASEAS